MRLNAAGVKGHILLPFLYTQPQLEAQTVVRSGINWGIMGNAAKRERGGGSGVPAASVAGVFNVHVSHEC